MDKERDLFLKAVYRWTFYILGMLVLALGLTLNTKAGLGVSPIISIAFAVSEIWQKRSPYRFPLRHLPDGGRWNAGESNCFLWKIRRYFPYFVENGKERVPVCV